MMRNLTCVIVVAWLATVALPASTFVVDKSQSTLAVDAKASPPHTFTSVARDYQCDIAIEPETLAATRAEVSFAFADLDSGKEKRDSKMMKWMDSDTHPDARFVLNHVETRNGKRVGIGKFIMHGISKEIEVPFTITHEGESIILDGTAEFDYTDWDLKIVRLLIFTVNPELKVHFHLTGQLAADQS